MRDVTDSHLMRRLREENEQLYGRALDVRRAATAWLEYVPATFPHYTRHTAAHSDNILLHLSELLYGDPNIDGGTTLGAVETYILIISAYLHDAGMVVSDADKIRLMETPDWHTFIGPGGAGHERWEALQVLRDTDGEAADAAAFAADVQLRFLIAELVRRHHHLRTAEILVQHENMLGGFAFGDGVLRNTVASVCAGHGMRIREIESSSDYPSRRLVLHEPVNVLFLTILLRIGDLLDMSADRACPLLLNAASPLPSDSYAHWSQYGCITHQMTAPDRIEITAACQEQEEHRFLADWTSWLVQELADARSVMARAERHGNWVAPHAAIAGDNATIAIRPAPNATYVPTDWKLVLDERAVVDRLVKDTYTDRLAFLRELLRNAADATRCRLYAEAGRQDIPLPDSPTRLPDNLLARFPIRIELTRHDVSNDLADRSEARWMLTVADHGIGMTHDRIRNYFLQVGQSFYRSPEFKENYTFEPGSRFGVGFLSVFAESSDVSVETRADHPDAEPIRLRLTGVRNYLLTERGNRTTPGTTVEILLNDALDSYELVQAVKAWCRFVEVPIDLKTPNHEIRIEAERAQEFEASAPVIGTEGATMAVRAFPAEIPGIEGSLYVFEYRDADGADWTAERWARNTYLNRQPGAVVPPRPASVTCFQGIATDGLRIDSEGSSVRVDVRQEVADMPLTREPGQATRAAIARKIEGRWAALITEHLDTEPRGHGPLAWRYKHRLMQKFDEVDAFWMAMADTTPFWHGEDRMGSVTDVAASESLASAVMLEDLVRVLGDVEYVDGVIMWPFDVPSLGPMTLGYASRIARAKLFAGRVITKVVRSGDAVVALWRKGDRAAWAMRRLYGGQQADAVSLGDIGLIGFRFHQADDSTYPRCVLNSDHPFIEWWIRAMTACDAGLCGLRPADGDRLHALLMTPVFYQGYELTALSEYLERWAQLPGLDTDLVPPSWDLGQEAFEARRLSGLASDEP